MKIVYRPEDGPGWEVDANSKLMAVELIAIERYTGLTLPEFEEAFKKGSLLAIHALIWVLRRRDDPTLRYEALDFDVAALSYEAEEEAKKGEAPPSNAAGA